MLLIIRLLEDAGCSNDDLRLVRLLLARTTVVVRVNNETSTAFISTKGAFKSKLFTFEWSKERRHWTSRSQDMAI